MRRVRFNEAGRWIALVLFTPWFALAQKANPGTAPPGMVWISGGEFSMGAAVNGNGCCEMPMASNDAEPIKGQC